ncbi:MAG TPA: hypothetical protein VKG89_04150 [Solirubrobacterales bacterium]|nr:hypothetical protein [Solirubrobacterales bacterium]
MSPLGRVLFVVLLVASVVVAAVVVHARTPDLELQVTRFTFHFDPKGPAGHRVARIGFYVREGDPNATVEIVGPNLRPTRTLYQGPVEADQPQSYAWNGRTDSGAFADPHDRYRLRVVLPSRDRDMVYPQRIVVQEAKSG